jgi:hypothetical protein
LIAKRVIFCLKYEPSILDSAGNLVFSKHF